jgi:xylan 1,4-beta-xylosidase
MKHMINRYGTEEVGSWRFEMMITRRNSSQFETSDIDSYIELFLKIQRVIKTWSPDSQMGGPGFNLGFPDDFDKMVKILYVLNTKNCSPDFFTVYAFSLSSIFPGSDMTGSGNIKFWAKDECGGRIARAKTFIQSQDPSAKRFFVTEWSLDFSCRDMLHDSLLKATFVLQNCINSIGTIDTLAYWLASDISAEYSDSSAILFGGAGLVNRHNIPKPSFFAYRFLSSLGHRLVAKGEGYIITAKSANNYAAVIFNYKYIKDSVRLEGVFRGHIFKEKEFLEDTKNLSLTLNLKGLVSGRYKVRQQVLNHLQGSLYDAWGKLGLAEELQAIEVDYLRNACVPAMKIDFISCDGLFTLEYELEPNEVRLIEISLVH